MMMKFGIFVIANSLWWSRKNSVELCSKWLWLVGLVGHRVTAGECGPSCKKGKWGRGTKSSKTSSLIQRGGRWSETKRLAGIRQPKQAENLRSKNKPVWHKKTNMNNTRKQVHRVTKTIWQGRHGWGGGVIYTQGGKTQVKQIGNQLRREKEQRGEVKLTAQGKTRLSK